MNEYEDDSISDDESGNDITNNNYRVHREQGVQYFSDISLPCVLLLESENDDPLHIDAHDRHSTSQRKFHIEIREEGYDGHGQITPVTCQTFPKQGFGMVNHKHIAHAVKAYHGSDVQKMGYMINCVRDIEDMLHSFFAFDKECRLQERFEYVENRLHSDIAELNKCLGKVRDAIDRVEKCPRIQVKCDSETADHDTQTDTRSVCIGKYSNEKSIFERPTSHNLTAFTEAGDNIDDKSEETNSESECSDSTNITDDSNEKETTCMFDETNLQRETGTRNKDIFKPTLGEYIENFTSETEMEKSQEVEWKIDHKAWLSCLELQDHSQIRTLLKERKLPDQDLLDKASSIFGRCSPIVSDICISVCKYLRGKASENYIDIWPAYFYDKDTTTALDNITFVVIKANQRDLDIGDVFRTYEREASICSTESKYMNKLEYDSEIDFADLPELTNCVNQNSATLMRNHSKLTMVSASSKISKGYKSDKKILDRQCVTLYVHVKGYIPLQEKPFPEHVGDYPVDVREAVFKQFLGGRPNEHHENLRMGCAIRGSTENEHELCFAGTLGGFLEHPKHGLCCITCGHVLCRNLDKLPNNGKVHLTDQESNIPVFQPVCPQSCSFGHLVSLVYNTGGNGDSGVEVALIKLDSRFPVDGRFPDTDKGYQTGFSEEKPMAYCNGKICELEELNKGSVVIKYGWCTEITRGVFRLKGGAVRTSNPVGEHGGAGFLLHNQIEILSAGEDVFAANGDSGAFVFIEENDELSLVGMLEGGLDDGRFIVTPVKDILKALELPIEGTLKTFGKDSDLLSPASAMSLYPNVLFRSSTPKPSRPFSNSRTDSAISMNTSVSEDASTSVLLSLVDDRLKVANDNISQEVAKQVSQIKAEMSENMDNKLTLVKAELKNEIQQCVQQQTDLLQQFLSRLAFPQKE